jgi:hypothetical protein
MFLFDLPVPGSAFVEAFGRCGDSTTPVSLSQLSLSAMTGRAHRRFPGFLRPSRFLWVRLEGAGHDWMLLVPRLVEGSHKNSRLSRIETCPDSPCPVFRSLLPSVGVRQEYPTGDIVHATYTDPAFPPGFLTRAQVLGSDTLPFHRQMALPFSVTTVPRRLFASAWFHAWGDFSCFPRGPGLFTAFSASEFSSDFSCFPQGSSLEPCAAPLWSPSCPDSTAANPQSSQARCLTDVLVARWSSGRGGIADSELPFLVFETGGGSRLPHGMCTPQNRLEMSSKVM